MRCLVINAPYCPRCRNDWSVCLCSLKWRPICEKVKVAAPTPAASVTPPAVTAASLPESPTNHVPKIRSIADVYSGLSANEKQDTLIIPCLTFGTMKTPKKDVKVSNKRGHEIPLPVIL